ncbi:MAG: hypothetical protein FWF55_03575, partial [Treponema sp.]|nr:hypothetical protein [Treponema sp.]
MSDFEEKSPGWETPEKPKVDISEISKNGYRLLRENHIDEAIDCFASILQIDENNNYALVGMGDAIRKRGSCREAAEF